MDIIYRLIHDRRHQAEVSSQVETNGQLSSRKVAAPWGLGELYAYQVWAELSKECLHHAELWMACTLTKEAERHAKVYGGGKSQRGRANIARVERRGLGAVLRGRRVVGQRL